MKAHSGSCGATADLSPIYILISLFDEGMGTNYSVGTFMDSNSWVFIKDRTVIYYISKVELIYDQICVDFGEREKKKGQHTNTYIYIYLILKIIENNFIVCSKLNLM